MRSNTFFHTNSIPSFTTIATANNYQRERQKAISLTSRGDKPINQQLNTHTMSVLRAQTQTNWSQAYRNKALSHSDHARVNLSRINRPMTNQKQDHSRRAIQSAIESKITLNSSFKYSYQSNSQQAKQFDSPIKAINLNQSNIVDPKNIFKHQNGQSRTSILLNVFLPQFQRLIGACESQSQIKSSLIPTKQDPKTMNEFNHSRLQRQQKLERTNSELSSNLALLRRLTLQMVQWIVRSQKSQTEQSKLSQSVESSTQPHRQLHSHHQSSKLFASNQNAQQYLNSSQFKEPKSILVAAKFKASKLQEGSKTKNIPLSSQIQTAQQSFFNSLSQLRVNQLVSEKQSLITAMSLLEAQLQQTTADLNQLKEEKTHWQQKIRRLSEEVEVAKALRDNGLADMMKYIFE